MLGGNTIERERGMKNTALFVYAVMFAGLTGIEFRAEAPPESRIVIDGAAPRVAVNPRMYGLFFEEINHSGDGGLYAEMVRNRNFESNNVPEGMEIREGLVYHPGYGRRMTWPIYQDPILAWRLLEERGASGSMQLDAEVLLNAAQTRSLRLDIGEARPSARVGVANDGFWGMSVQEGEGYRLSLFTRADRSFRSDLVAVLEDREGHALSEPVRLSGTGPEWKRLHGRLQARATHHEARLALYAEAPGTIWLDVVSLFPENAYRAQPNGLRPDLVALLKAMRPGFLRFPGGCITEGLTLEQAYQWKRTLGDISERPGVWNAMFGYRRTDGLGYFEYLQLAAWLNATPIFCFNMGMTCTIHTSGNPVPLDEMQPYIDDALDAIAYANDPPDTEWGALRAQHGHPEPFDMKYVNIGNELHGTLYAQRYDLFYPAVKARYPDMQTIAYGAIGTPRQPIEIIDLHDYRDDLWYLHHLDRFDDYDRSRPRIANMELAVRNQTLHTLHNALLESAYMIGLERNADVVQLVSYAPLLANVNDTRWRPVLIHLDNHQSFGTPSYYAQMLFMHHRPDEVLETRVDAPQRRRIALGRAGVGTLDTQAEFRAIEVRRGEDIVHASGTVPAADRWDLQRLRAEDGLLRQGEERGDHRALLRDPLVAEGSISLQARKISGRNGFRIYLGSFYGHADLCIELGGDGNRSHFVHWSRWQASEKVPGQIEEGRWYDVRVETRGGEVRCFLDGVEVLRADLPAIPAVVALGGMDHRAGELVVKMVNLSDEDRPVTIECRNIQPGARAQRIMLTSGSRYDENSFAHPEKVSPVADEVAIPGASFAQTVPRHSMVVLRVPAHAVNGPPAR